MKPFTHAPAELRARYDAGASLLQLCADTGLNYRQLRNHLEAAGTVMRPRPQHLGSAPPEMVAAYRSGQSLVAVAASWGISDYTVRRMLRDAGVQIRRPGRPQKPSQKRGGQR